MEEKEKEKDLHIEVANIDDLIPDDRNFNKGSEDGRKLIERSFAEHGAGRSVLLDRNNRLIAGNKSREGFKAAGGQKVVIVDADADTLVAVRRGDVDLDSAEGRRMALLDNLTTQVSLQWDKEALESVAAEVEGFDYADYGLEFEAVADPNEADKVEEDDFDPDKEHYDPVTKPGDIITLGDHRLMCGDSTKADDVQRLMQGEMADLWLTDPPYNVDYSSKNDYLNKVDKGNLVQVAIENDKMSDAEFHQFLHNAFAAAEGVMKAGCPFYVWYASKEHRNFMDALIEAGLSIRQELVWNKNNFVLGRLDYQPKHEPCLYGWKDGAAHYFINARNLTTVYESGLAIPDYRKMKKGELLKLLDDIFLEAQTPSTVINCPKPQKSADHPTMKPVRLFGYQMANSSRPGDIILDTFGGSGTTIVAAEQLGRKARLMELDPHYCDVIIARWEKLTGRKAVRAGQ